MVRDSENTMSHVLIALSDKDNTCLGCTILADLGSDNLPEIHLCNCLISQKALLTYCR